MTNTASLSCALALFVLAVPGCGEVVHIRLKYQAGELAKQDCDAVAQQTQSFYAELEGEVLSFQKCINIGSSAPPPTLAELEARIAGRIVFQDVPEDGSWTIWVEAFQTRDCRKVQYAPLLCGKQEGQTLLEGDLSIHVACVPSTSFWPSDVLKSVCRIQ